MGAALGRDPFEETEDQSSLRQLARDLAEREVAPRAAAGDRTGDPPHEAAKALAAADLLRVTVGEAHGGFGYGDVEASIVLEEIARADVSTAIWCQLTYNGPPRGISHLGSEALKDRWLPKVAAGEALISIGITEPDAGSAVQEMRTNLVEDLASGGWRLNGYKNYSTLGHVAHGVLVWCRWPGGSGAKGIGAVIVPMDREGVALAGVHSSMGVHAATEAEIAFDDVAISADDVLIEGNPDDAEAFKVLLGHLNHERCGNASMCVGAAQGALEYATRHLNDRVIGGEALASRQGLQWKLADMSIELESARLLLRRAVHLAGDGGTPPALETAMAKAAANRAAKSVCDESMQLLGGYGYSAEYPLERAYRDIRGLCIGAGTIEAQLNFVGSNVARGRTTSSPGWIAQRFD
ncbi:MAG: butyryl-CoA dehydrogenase [Actinomycetia bacterium]|nr:butyryl-CoA dehydrogenase [Actinomycetes bacterium]